jgi:hypothetical protein
MSSVQYVIDTICASVSAECVFKMVEELLKDGSFKVDELLPLIQSKDRSLDRESARMIARAAITEMAQRSTIRIEGDVILTPE